ncbi:glycosyltransferase family 2 protein [Rathayibacter sp. YIM 133350]|uniref:glycosyltransferase family 2 protein n=1 Tax=Rathayibacter sp. YIM 133350 TaxID=3131992 RepID=UPI00307F787B
MSIPQTEPAARIERTQATVSLVLPVKDDAELLRRCLGMLSEQSVAPHEVIVVDNGSRDDSAEIARAAGARVLRELHPGIPAAAAAGCDAATGDVIARLDADCMPPREWVQRISAAFDADPGLAALTGPAFFVDGPAPLRRPLAALYLGAYRAAVSPALGHPPLFGSNFAVRRSAWTQVSDSVHRYDPLMHDDMDLSVHLGPERRIRFERSLQMGISMRPFSGGGLLRLRRGFHSVFAHWPDEAPWKRWRRRLRAAKAPA